MNLYDHYSQLIEEELLNRQRLNRNYSLRAFARDLNLSASKLSELLSKKQGLSLSKARSISKILGLDTREEEYFLCLVEKFDSRSRKVRHQAEKRLLEIESQAQLVESNIDNNFFDLISDWKYFTIMELLGVFEGEYNDVIYAKCLNISTREMHQYFQKLLDLELIQIKNGKFVRSKKEIITKKDIPRKSIRHYHETLLKRSLLSLEFDQVEDREFNSLIFKIHSEQVALLKNKIREQISQMNNFAKELNQEKKPDSVFVLNSQLYNLINRSY